MVHLNPIRAFADASGDESNCCLNTKVFVLGCGRARKTTGAHGGVELPAKGTTRSYTCALGARKTTVVGS